MKINIICIGKLKEKYWVDGADEYLKRLKAFCHAEVVELKEEKLAKNASPSDEEIVKVKEGQAILSKIKDSDYVIALEINGKQLSSIELANTIGKLMGKGNSTIDFIIGGSLGLSSEVSKRADYSLSFSKMTFPHQMMRVILLEQIYRSFMINQGAVYHK